MALPPNAEQFEQEMDPSDLVEWQALLSQGNQPVLDAAGKKRMPMLRTGENVASYTLAVTADAAFAGLTIKTGAGYATTLTGRWLEFHLTVAASEQSSTAFTGDGLLLAIELTATTDKVPPRIRQKTMLVRVRNQ